MCAAERDDPSPLSVEDLRKSFRGHLGIGRTVVLHGVSFHARRGEIFGLLGPNGAGKTTTLKIALGLMRADRGTVRLFGRAPWDPAARARVGFLPENPYFYDYLSGEEFLDFYARLKGIARDDRRRRVREAMERVGLSGRERHRLRKYSKGMTQRLGIAQAILGDPELVVLDEPMSGLDPVGRREVRDLILELRRAGKAVCFSSHILQDAELVCDRVAILVDGRVRCSGPLEDMVSREVGWFEVTVRGVAPEGMPAEPLSSTGEGTLLRVADTAALARVLRAVQERGGEIVAVWPRRQSLEDRFLFEVGSRGEGSG